jgi:putative FmdB family regulatory protein
VPTYQYACTACGEQLEAVQSFTDPPLTECPVCGGPLRKVFSAVGVVFKGSGFYKNDSRKSASTSDKPSEKPSEKPAAAKADSGTKTDSKPAAKSESGSSSSSTGSTSSTTPAA